MVLFFIVDYVSCFFLLVATFLLINFSILYFLHICIYEPDMLCQIFFLVGF